MKKIIVGIVVFSLTGPIVFAQTNNVNDAMNAPIKIQPVGTPLPVQMPPKPGEILKQERERIQNEIKNVRGTGNADIEAIREAAKKQAEAQREAMKQGTEAAREAFKTEREGILKQIPTNPQEALKMLQDRRDVFQKEIEAKKETFKTTIEAKRAETQKAIEAKREEIKTKINQFKDEQKKKATENVNASLNEVNKNAINRFTNNINELEKAVVNITTRAEKATANGKDVSNVFAAIQSAKTAIEAARVAVTAQAGKVYSVTVTTEAKIATDLKQARDGLNKDLKAVQDKIKSAHEAVWVALTGLQNVPEVNKPLVLPVPTTGSQPVAPVTQ